MADMKCELSLFFDALVKASAVLAQQRKIVAVQIQYTKTGLEEIMIETGSRKWRNRVELDVARECALVQLYQIRLTNLHAVSVSDAHLLETHAQRSLMLLTSYDRFSVINQLYNASALPVDGMSRLDVSDILAVGDRATVVTITILKGNPGVAAQPSPARNDFVFGPNRFKVCRVVCNCIHTCFNQLILPIFLIPATDMFGPGHAFHGDPQHDSSGPSGPPDSPPLH